MQYSLKDRIHTKRNGKQVAFVLQLNKGTIKTPYFQPDHYGYVFRKMFLMKITNLVKQRRFQIEHNLTRYNTDTLQALKNALAKVDHLPNWNQNNFRTTLKAILPNLIAIAPTTGRFLSVWEDLIEVVELISTQPNIGAQLKEVVYG